MRDTRFALAVVASATLAAATIAQAQTPVNQTRPAAKNALTVSFTPLGRRALAGAKAVRDSLRDRLAEWTAELTEAEKGTVTRFVETVESLMLSPEQKD